ncbi:MAG: glycosyltransferase family 2 protein [Elusimicrobia bacterium]|nr:glycosyltransferase family 2 protein [Elusimicrobiota bacterium]
MYQDQKISLILPAYNEQEHIEEAVKEFRSMGIIDEILVIDNNSRDQTADLARRAGATVIGESKQGLGNAILRGFNSATGDLVFVAEPDGTFVANDVWKFLAYIGDFDIVLGTRTAKELIWQGANMKFFLRVGNTTVAKMLELLFSGCSLSDCGCTFRLIRKSSLKKIMPHMTVGGSHCNPELVIWAFRKKFKVIEIPINYRPRVGISKITGSWKGVWRTGLGMIALILLYRLKFLIYDPR